MTGQIFTPMQLAVALGLPAERNSERKVLDWRSRYQWPHFKIGNLVRFTERDLEEIVQRHSRKAPPARPAKTGRLPGQTKRSAARS